MVRVHMEDKFCWLGEAIAVGTDRAVQEPARRETLHATRWLETLNATNGLSYGPKYGERRWKLYICNGNQKQREYLNKMYLEGGEPPCWVHFVNARVAPSRRQMES